ncbi:hypothetical protein M977_01428 [Buttiauxella gaviniae ATCC 51604]|uniref:Uncharacterized protein n=1 Tax=Buttiauxella gaviniae ATCC 51604 TaxID=1354253 RepID=A0A1B7I3H7_9ENTR|nr:Ig-like domain-containing protein [Buttiauxella gaviniae]OAT22803.1 hypothetical protein M977_01428 [Buttiauxella gaviniae ATCC 51604]
MDASGNTAIAVEHKTVVLDTQAHNAVTIDTVAGDNIVNAHEGRMPTFISGNVTGDAQAGDHVVVSVNGHNYNGVVVDNNGQLRYEVPVPTAVLNEGSNDVQVMVTGVDASGNTAIATEHKTVTVDTHANNSVTINDATSDNILNHTELGHHNQTITGVVGGDAQIGDEVTLEINGHYYRGRVEDMHDGKGTLGYKIPVPSTEFGDNKTILNKDVSVKATLVSHDAAGNEAIVVSEHTIHVDNHAYNGVSINTVAGDDVVNAGESKHETLVTGRITGKDAHIGDAVDVTVGKTTVHGTIFADPQGHLYYEAKIPTGVLIEGNNDVTVKVTSHDTAHNEAVAIEHTTITLDTHADATISIHELTAGPVLNHDELSTPKQLITGDVGGDAQVGDKVSIEINGHFYGGNVVDLGNGHLGYQIPVDSSAFGDNQQHLDGDMKIIARVTSHDAAGNEVTATTDHTVHIDNYAEGHITTNPVTGDNIINYDESGQTTTKITGTVSSTATGQIDEGDKVIITVNNQSYETTVIKLPYQHGALGYSVDVPTKDLLADPNPIAHVVAHDAAGNENHFEVTNHIGIDLQADASITIDKVTGDDMINGDESDKEFTKVSGTVGDDVKEGDVVHLVINGNDLTTEVTKDTNGNLVWHKEVSTHDLMVDPHFTATVTATDNANNTATAHADRTVVVDLKVEAVITIDSVTPDNTLNGEELHHKYTLVSGTLTGEMKPGEEVTLKVNGKDYHGTVELDSQGNMVYNVLVDTTDLHQDPNIHASINVIDDALNHKLATADHHVGIDDHANASLTINVVSGDNILNQADQTHPTTTINGTVGGDVHRGDTVHVMVNNTDYAATVEPQTHLNGALGYSVDVNTADLLANGHIDATVSTEDKHGNTITVHTDHDVARDDGAQATISIDTVAGDDWLNNVEAHQDHTTITGKVTGDVHLNDIVDLEVNGQHYYGSVVAQGNGLGYSINVSTDDLLAGGDKPILHASVTGYDDAGNTFLATADHEVAIDTLADVQIKADTANANNNNGPDYYIVTGHVKGDDVHEHDHVLITVGTKTYDTEVIRLSDGKLGFSQNVDDPKYVAAHPDITVQISGTDPHGNPIMATDHIHANVPGYPSGGNTGGTTTTPPHYDPPHAVITISPIAGNDVINKVESEKGTTTIRGTVTGDVHAGEFVTLHIGNQDIPVKVVDRPHLPGELGYEIEVDTKLLMAHPDISVTATAHNGAGDTAAVGVQKTVLVDTHVTAEIHLDNIAGDNVINILESKSGTTTVSGTVNGDGIHNGSNVTIMVDGHPVTTQVFTDSNGVMRFSKDISVNDLRHTPDITVSVTGHDDQGNTFTATDGKTITVDTEVKAEVAIDSVTGDNILNLHETQQATTTITGHVSGDVHPGEHVTLTVNGQVYQNVEIGQDLKYAVDVKTSDLQLGNEIKAEVTGHDDHGNSTTGHATAQYSTDISAAATITTNTVSGDNILSAKDLSADKTQISGTVGGDAAVGDKVTVTLNGVTETADVKLDSLTGKLVYTLEVDTHNLKVQLESQHTDKPEIIVTVTGQDNAGNDFSQDVHKVITIDDHANVTLTFDNVTQDNILNIEESNQPTTQISGTVTGDVKDGGTVILTVNGNERPVTIHGDPTNGFTFKLDVPTSDLLTNQTITYKVTGVDGVGNTLTVNDTNTIAIDHDVKNEVHIATVAGDDKVNIAEHSNPTTMITGTVSGDAQDGDTVTLMLNGKPVVGGDYILHNGQKTFEIAVDNSLLKETDNTLDVTLAGHDTSGNLYTSTDTHTITLDTTIGAHITLAPVATDDVINAKESDHVSVTGTVAPDGDAKLGDEVSVMVNGKTPFVGKVIDLDGQGHLGYDIHVDKGLLQEGKNTFDVSIKATDDAGNEITVHDGHEVQMDTQLAATITLDPVAANNVVNAAAVDHVSVTGTVSTDSDAHVGDKVTVTVNGHSFTGVVQDINGHPGYDIPVDKTLLHEGTNTFDVSIDATDKAGNAIIVHAGHDVQVDTQIAASITLDPVAANDVVNAAALDHVSVTGAVSTDSDAKLGDEVTVKVNGHSFTGVVKDINGHPGYDIHVDKGLLHEGDNTVAVSIRATDGVGNAITVEASHTVHVDTEINATITIDPVAGDDIINAAEVDNVSVTGTVGTDVDAHVGASVIVTVNGTTFTGAVIDLDGKGHLGYNIPVDKTLLLEGDNTVGVSIDATDSAGNATIVETTHTVHVDTEINASITLDPVGTNDVVNAAAFDHVSVTGAVSTDSDAQLGDKVTVKVNGHSFTGVVQDINGHPGYDIHVDKGLLHEGTNTFDVSIDATDKAGNPITVHTGHDVQVDTQIAATITLNPVAGNDVINASELDHVSVTGAVSTDSDAQLGDSVTVKVNGHSFTGVVQNINGHLGYDIPVDKALLHEGKNTFDVSIDATDKVGNPITVHAGHDVQMDTHADAKITIDKVTGDDHIDSQEARHHVTHITGQIDSADVHNNEHINVTINDKHYDVILHEDNGHLTYDVPVNTNELHIGKNSVGVSVIANDDHGNTNVIHQNADFTMDDPSHRGKHDVDGSDKSHHAANAHSHDNGLSNLFDDSHDTFSFNLAHDSKGHHGDESLKIFTGKENHGNEKVDLSDLAHELHEGTDITQMIKGGDAHHGKGGASAADAPSVTPTHGGDAHHASFDSAGAATHSLDHLIPKPEHYHS